jgi:hypothetical protein
MAKRSSNSLVGLLIVVILFLLGILYTLFQPSTPTVQSTKSGVIPLGNASFTRAADIQNSAAAPNTQVNPQQAAVLKPDDLKSLSL